MIEIKNDKMDLKWGINTSRVRSNILEIFEILNEYSNFKEIIQD
jgi:hypothetical protein